MKTTIQSPKEFLSNTASSGLRFTTAFQHGEQGGLGTESAGTSASVFFVVASVTKNQVSAKEPSDLIQDLLGKGLIQESDISKGRQWVAGAFFEGQPESLKTLRLKAGFSQAQLAERISMSQPNICEFEAGKRKPSTDTLIKLSDALGVSVDVVLKSMNLMDEK